MSGVGDMGGKYQGGVLDNIVGGALFLKLIPKIHRKGMMYKVITKLQVSGHIHFEHTLFFRASFKFLNLKLFKGFQNRFVLNIFETLFKVFSCSKRFYDSIRIRGYVRKKNVGKNPCHIIVGIFINSVKYSLITVKLFVGLPKAAVKRRSLRYML